MLKLKSKDKRDQIDAKTLVDDKKENTKTRGEDKRNKIRKITDFFIKTRFENDNTSGTRELPEKVAGTQVEEEKEVTPSQARLHSLAPDISIVGKDCARSTLDTRAESPPCITSHHIQQEKSRDNLVTGQNGPFDGAEYLPPYFTISLSAASPSGLAEPDQVTSSPEYC